jgi:hypothetical protein
MKSVECKKSVYFTTSDELLAESETELEETAFSDSDFNGLQCTFLDYFLFTADEVSCLGNPFSGMEIFNNMSVQDYEALINIISYYVNTLYLNNPCSGIFQMQYC